jgi:hypothetical protein
MSDSNLRSGLIRLAHAKPELRPVLLPLLTKQAATPDLANKSGAKGKGVPNHLKKDVETFIEDFGSRIKNWDKFYRDTKGLSHAKKMVEALKKGDLDEAQKHAEALDKTDPGIVNNSMWAVFKDRRSNLPKSASLLVAAGQPDYANLTKRLTMLLNSMSPSHAKMVEAVSQTLQAWATANGLDVRHNLKEIAEDLLYNAYSPGKPTVDARQVLRVMQGQYASAFTSRVAAAGIPVTLKKKLSLKDGTVIEAGEKGTLRFNEQTPRQAVVDFDVRPNTKLGCRLLGDYFGRPFMKEPSMSALENMGDGIAKSVTGKKVEPDGYGPDGSPSWLLALGYI